MSLSPLAAVRLLADPNVLKSMILQLAWQRARLAKKGPMFARLVSVLMVAVSSFIRVPQIQKLLDPPTLAERVAVARGLSIEGISLETVGYLIHVVYNQQGKVPFVNYGETFLVGLQNAVIILLIRYYRARGSGLSEAGALFELVQPVAVMAALVVALGRFAAPDLVQALQVLNIPIGILSKLPQIRRNWTLQLTGHLSNVTVAANCLGSLARVFTTVQDAAGDQVLLLGYGCSFVLNAVLAAQCAIYG